MKKFVLLAVLVGLVVAPVSADILVDFGKTNGNVASPDDNGNYWNEADKNDTVADLVDDANSLTGISMAVSVESHTASNRGTTSPTGAFATYDMSVQNAVGESPSDEYLYTNDATSTSTITFGGMTQGDELTFIIYGGAGYQTASYSTRYEATGNGAAVDQTIVTGTSGVANSSLVASLTQTADAAGEIVVTIHRGDGSGFAQINAMQIVPEPATMTLLAIGGIGVLIRRRRR